MDDVFEDLEFCLRRMSAASSLQHPGSAGELKCRIVVLDRRSEFIYKIHYVCLSDTTILHFNSSGEPVLPQRGVAFSMVEPVCGSW